MSGVWYDTCLIYVTNFGIKVTFPIKLNTNYVYSLHKWILTLPVASDLVQVLTARLVEVAFSDMFT